MQNFDIRGRYFSKLMSIERLTYRDFSELYMSYFEDGSDEDFSESEHEIIGYMNEKFDMTSALTLEYADREDGWITYVEFQKFVATEILPKLIVRN